MEPDINKLGIYAAISTTVLTLATFAISFLTPPLSGPWCEASCIAYPYENIASRFPRDYIWMFFALVQLVSYLALMAIVHRSAPKERNVFSLIGLCFATGAASILMADYYVQLFVVQASLLQGESAGIPLLTQYNPHGVFIALENIGYLLMSLGFLFFAPALRGTKAGEVAKWIFIVSFVLSMLFMLYMSFAFGTAQEYRFEIAVISFNWLALLLAGPLLARMFFVRKNAALQPNAY